MKPLHRLPSIASKPVVGKPSAALLGLGFDNDDETKRITKGDNFLLLGGSKDTHERMQETAIKVNEILGRKGMRLEDVSPRELFEIIDKAVR